MENNIYEGLIKEEYLLEAVKVIPTLYIDFVFKAVFKDNLNVLAKMLSDIMNIDYEMLKDNIALVDNEIPITRLNEKARKCDFIIKISDNSIVNLEINSLNYRGYKIKNLSYAFSLYSKGIKRGENYHENFMLSQLNLNTFGEYSDDNFKFMNTYALTELNSHNVYTKSFKIYSLDVAKCYKLFYNNDKKIKKSNQLRWGALICAKTLDEVDEILGSMITVDEKNKFKDTIAGLTEEDYKMTASEIANVQRLVRNSIYDEGLEDGIEKGFEQGIEQGMEQGIEQTKTETIKSMYKEGIDLEVIAKITDKSITEINEILK